MSLGKRSKHLSVVISVAVIAGFVAVATLVQAIRQDSWEPILATGWAPAVLVGWLCTRPKCVPCRTRLRDVTDR